VVLAAASAVMLAAIVYAVGARRTLEAVGQAGFTAFGAVGLTLLASLLLRATAWAVLNRPIRHRAPFRTLLAAETVGQAGNILTPSTYLGGEPLKVVYVGRTTGHRYGEVAGTVLLSKYVEMTSFAFVFAAGTVIACVAFRDVLLSGAHFWAGVMLLTVAAAILGLFVALWLAMSREWCPLRRIVRGLARLGPFHRFFARLAWRTGKMEKQVSRVVAEEGGAVRVVFALFLGVHAMILVRPVVFFWAGWRFGLGLGEMSLIFAASQALLCFQFTPSGVGTLDGGLLGVFALLGLGDAQCMAYLLCQRFWDTVVVAAGITLAGQAGTKIVAEKLGGIAPAGGAAGGRLDLPRAADSPGDGPPRRFPHVWTPPAHVPRYARFRAEGLAPSACVWGAWSYFRKYRNKLAAAPPEELEHFRLQRRLLRALASLPPGAADRASLAMVGDIMWIGRDWSSFLDPAVLACLNSHQAVVGNLETVISPQFRLSRAFPEFAWFNSAPGLVDSFRRDDGRSTFAALSIANNHVMDYRDAGARDLMSFLDERGIARCGLRRAADEPAHAIFQAGGIRFGYYAATYGLNDPTRRRSSGLLLNRLGGLAPEGRDEPDLSPVRAALAGMTADGADLRIVSLHWGFEYELFPTPRQMQLARRIVRAGADVVVGSHPHVVQPAEVIFVNGYAAGGEAAALAGECGCAIEDGGGRPRKALVCYSLGNFVTAMSTFLCRAGLVQPLHVYRRGDGADWDFQPGRYVYNVRRDSRTGGRRLAMLADRLGELDDEGRAGLEWLAGHVVAEPLGVAGGRPA